MLRKIKLYPIWRTTDCGKWLSEMSACGWLLEDVIFCIYVFRKAPSKKMSFFVDRKRDVLKMHTTYPLLCHHSLKLIDGVFLQVYVLPSQFVTKYQDEYSQYQRTKSKLISRELLVYCILFATAFVSTLVVSVLWTDIRWILLSVLFMLPCSYATYGYIRTIG